MIEAALLDSLRDLVFGVLVGLALVAGLLYLEARSERHLPAQAQVDPEEERLENWDFPPRWQPPAAETHFEDRRAA